MANEAPQSLWQQVHGTLGKIQERHAANIDIYTYYRYNWFEAWYESAMEVLHDMDPDFLRTFYGIAKPAAPEGECKRDDEPDVHGTQQQERPEENLEQRMPAASADVSCSISLRRRGAHRSVLTNEDFW